VYNGVEEVMVRNWETAIQKDSMCLVPVNNCRALQSWMKSVGIGGISLNAGVPIMQSFYAMLVRNAGDAKINPRFQTHLLKDQGRRFMFWGQRAKVRRVCDDARVSFWKAFKICPDQQIELEKYYDGLTLDMSEITPLEIFEFSAKDTNIFIDFEAEHQLL
jgi:hypothetical protein